MRKMAVVLLCFILILTVSSCGSPSEADLLETRNTDISPDLTFDHSMPLDMLRNLQWTITMMDMRLLPSPMVRSIW